MATVTCPEVHFRLMTELRPTTVTLKYDWDRTRFELLDARSAVLAMFEEYELLRSFRSPQDGLSVRLIDGRSFDVSMDRVEVYELRVGAATAPEMRSSADLAAEIGSLLGVHGVVPRASFQHVVPWDLADKDEAFRRGAHAIVPDANKLGATDFALLFDGQMGESWMYQAEAGVIDADEAPARFARRIGRSDSSRPDSWMLGALEQIEVAEVATFVDSAWWLSKKVPILFEEAEELLRQAESLASDVVGTLHRSIS